MYITLARTIWSLPESNLLKSQAPLSTALQGRQRAPLVLPAGLALLLALLSFAHVARGHFNLNLNIRIFHIEHVDDGLDVYLRVPMPYLVAHLAGPEQADGNREPAPFTSNAMVDGQLMHYVDYQALLREPELLAQLAADGHQFHHRQPA